jgi:hypothetical protein
MKTTAERITDTPSGRDMAVRVVARFDSDLALYARHLSNEDLARVLRNHGWSWNDVLRAES